MYALIDCDSFFCSVERVFHPGLRGCPVCVLSCNDGCIVALTREAKALGLRRGDPIFRVSEIVRRGHVRVFSSNLALYAAMSRRITRILRKSIAEVESYSIDESFCNLSGYEGYGLEAFMRGIVERIRLWTDIPTSVGIASTKTLAKVAAWYAKRYKGYRSVCVIDTDEKRRRALGGIKLCDVWGIGRGGVRVLNGLGIGTPLDFADSRERVVRRLSLPLLRTWRELNGEACIDTGEVVRKRSICTSRSFGQMVSDMGSVKEAVAHFAACCAERLRGQECVAGDVCVFLSSNRFRTDLEQYACAATHVFATPTADTIEITEAAHGLVEGLYRRGILYKKAGVVLGGILPGSAVQLALFDSVGNRRGRAGLMGVMDGLNRRYGAGSVVLGAEGGGVRPWQGRCGYRSGCYLSDVDELLTVRL